MDDSTTARGLFMDILCSPSSYELITALRVIG
jgi:hypothetical protein